MSQTGRVFVRGISSETYDLEGLRASVLVAPRVRGADVVVDDGSVGHSGDRKGSRTWWRLGPGDEPFLTQTLQVHFVELQPGGSNRGHGHQNEALFYVLEGRGYEVHDGRRYDWEAGDLVVAHTDSVHRHFNASETDRALIVVFKAKSMWMFMGLTQQGRPGQGVDDEGFGPREDWSRLWTPGVEERVKVVKGGDVAWSSTPDGRVRDLTGGTDRRVFSVDLHEQEVPAGGRSAKHWHMADEVAYVLAGRGTSLHWEVRADLDDRFYARIAREPSRHEVGPGDLLYVPTNTVHQHIGGGTEPLRLLSGRNRVFRHLGYDNVHYFETGQASRSA